jgi:N4-gp56 family major capsid protein
MPGQVWAVSSLGGYFHSENLSQKLREIVNPMCKFRQFCDIKDATMQGKRKGSVFHWDVYGNVATQGTTLTETTAMPETSAPIYQGTLTITDAGNSVPYSGQLDNLSQFPVMEIIKKALKMDAAKFFDIQVAAQMSATYLRAAPAGSGTSSTAVTFTTNGTVTNTASVSFSADHCRAIIDWMSERNIPPFEGGDYFAITFPTTITSFYSSLEDIYQYTPEGFKMIKSGEIGRYYESRWIKHTDAAVPKDGTTSTDWIYFTGEDVVAEAICVPEEIRAKIPTDYGRSRGVAWYFLGGHGLSHTGAMNPDDCRVVRWESKA